MFPQIDDGTGEGAFVCPVCRCSSYSRPRFRDVIGGERRGSYYKCNGCDFAFTHPQVFQGVAEASQQGGSLMKVGKDDMAWLEQILAGLITDAVPEFDRSRLLALELIEQRPEGVAITPRGREALAQHYGLRRS
jgi:hypothetical protein